MTADMWRWPREAWAAFAAAREAGDQVERHAGVRPSLGDPRVSLILVWPPGRR